MLYILIGDSLAPTVKDIVKQIFNEVFNIFFLIFDMYYAGRKVKWINRQPFLYIMKNIMHKNWKKIKLKTIINFEKKIKT